MPNSNTSVNLTEIAAQMTADLLSSQVRNSGTQYSNGLKLPPIYFPRSHANVAERTLNTDNISPLYQTNRGYQIPTTTQNIKSRAPASPAVIDDKGGHVFKIPAFPDSAVRAESLKYSNVNNEELFRKLYATHPDIRGYINPDTSGPLNVLGLPHKFRVPHPSGHANGFLPFVYASNSRLPGPVVDAGVTRYSGYIDDEFKFRRIYDFHPHIHNYPQPEKNLPINVLGLPYQFRIPNPNGLVNGFRPPEVETNKYLPGPVVDHITNIPNLPIGPNQNYLSSHPPIRSNDPYYRTFGQQISYNNPMIQNKQDVLQTSANGKYTRDVSRLRQFIQNRHRLLHQWNENSKLRDNYATNQPHYGNINYNTDMFQEIKLAALSKNNNKNNNHNNNDDNNNEGEVRPYAKYSQGPIRYANPYTTYSAKESNARNIKYYYSSPTFYQPLTNLYHNGHDNHHHTSTQISVYNSPNRMSAVRFPGHQYRWSDVVHREEHKTDSNKKLQYHSSPSMELKFEAYDHASSQHPQTGREKQQFNQEIRPITNSQQSDRMHFSQHNRDTQPSNSRVRFPAQNPFQSYKEQTNANEQKMEITNSSNVTTTTISSNNNNNNNNNRKVNPPAYKFTISSPFPNRGRFIYKRPPIDHSKIKSKIPRINYNRPLNNDRQYDTESQHYSYRIRFPSIPSNIMKYDGVTNPIRPGRRFLSPAESRLHFHVIPEDALKGIREEGASHRYSPNSEYDTYQSPSYQNERYLHFSKEYDSSTKANSYQDNKGIIKNDYNKGTYRSDSSSNVHYDIGANNRCQGYAYQEMGYYNGYHDFEPSGWGGYQNGFHQESNYGRGPYIGPYPLGASYGSPNNYVGYGNGGPGDFYSGHYENYGPYDNYNNFYRSKQPNYYPRPRPSILRLLLRRLHRIIRFGLKLGDTLVSPFVSYSYPHPYRRSFEDETVTSTPPNTSTDFRSGVRNIFRKLFGL